MSLKVTDATFELLLALGGGDLVNDSNGRDGRASAVTFDDALGKDIFKWWANMYDDKLAQYQSLGVDEVVLRVPSGSADEMLAVLDHHATYLPRFGGDDA